LIVFSASLTNTTELVEARTASRNPSGWRSISLSALFRVTVVQLLIKGSSDSVIHATIFFLEPNIGADVTGGAEQLDDQLAQTPQPFNQSE